MSAAHLSAHDARVVEAIDWLRSLRGTKWTSVEEGGRTWDVDALAASLLVELDRAACSPPERDPLSPIHYAVAGLPHRYLAFRTETVALALIAAVIFAFVLLAVLT